MFSRATSKEEKRWKKFDVYATSLSPLFSCCCRRHKVLKIIQRFEVYHRRFKNYVYVCWMLICWFVSENL